MAITYRAVKGSKLTIEEVDANFQYLEDNIRITPDVTYQWIPGTLSFLVRANLYPINGISYSAPETTVTLEAADGTYDRFDVIVATSSNTVTYVKGTASASPALPDIDDLTQYVVTYVSIPTGATEPDLVTTEDIYLENTEWTTASNTSGVRIALASTNNPSTGTYCIESSSPITGDYITFDKGSNFFHNNYLNLSFKIRLKAAMPGNARIRLEWYIGSTLASTYISIRNGDYGFDNTNTTTYQTIILPHDAFAFTSLKISKLKIYMLNTCLGWYIDNVQYQTEEPVSPPPPSDIYFNDLLDVNAPTPTTGQVPTFNEATGQWEPATPSGSGDVNKVGTPVDNQVGVWTGDGTIEGDVDLTFDTATNTLSTGILNATSLTASELTASDGSKNIVSLAVATYPSLTELSYVKGVTSAIQTQLNAKGVGDMVLASVQSVTGLKTFDTTKLAVKGSSTGTTAIASANASGTSYTATLQAATGTIAYTSDITGTNSGTNTGDEPSATTSAEGVVELATVAEVQTGTDTTRAVTPEGVAKRPDFIMFAIGDEVSDLEVGTGKITFDMPNYATTITGVSASVVTAPTGSILIIDINEAGSSILKRATGTVTCASAIATDTVTINGLVYTAVAGAKADNTEFSIDTSDTATATDLAASVNADVRAGTLGDVSATSNIGVVTLTSNQDGSTGNATTLVSSNGTRLAVSGAVFSGGTYLTIDATEKTSTTAATAPVISDSAIAANAVMTVDIDQIGSTIAGAGAKIIIYYQRA